MAQPNDALRVFFDSSVVIAGAFSRKGASYILLQLSSLTLIDGRSSIDVRTETERNIRAKLPSALPALRVLLDATLSEGSALMPAALEQVKSYADAKDVPPLASAVQQQCTYLVTLNERDFWPPTTLIKVVRPGTLLQAIRIRLYQEPRL